jgi:hypothetical protein
VAGIKGQGSPSQLKSPVPGPEVDPFEAARIDLPEATAESTAAGQDPFASAELDGAGENAEAYQSPQRSWYDISGQGIGQATLDNLPTIGATVGGMAGFASPLPGGAVMGAGVGGAIGQSIKQSLERAIFNTPEKSIREQVTDVAYEGAKEATYQAAGGPIAKVIGKAAKVGKRAVVEAAERIAKTPQEIMETFFHAPEPVKEMAAKFGGDLPTAANAVRSEWNSVINQYQDKLEAPALQVIMPKTPAASAEEVATLVKNKVVELAHPLTGDIPDAASAIRMKLNESIKTTKDLIEKPALQVVAPRVQSPTNPGELLNAQEAGDTVRAAIEQDIMTKHGPFMQAYDAIDKVKAVTPIEDEARRGFTEGLQAFGNKFQHSPEKMKLAMEFKDKFNAASDGQAFDEVIDDLSEQINVAFSSGRAKSTAPFLTEMRDRAETFVKGRVESIARRVSEGRATPHEMNTIQEMIKARGINEPDPAKYAKVIARNYLKGEAKVSADYADFSRYMEDMSGATKVKKTSGAFTLIRDIKRLPSEKLIERMADTKNAEALSKLADNNPMAFNQVANFKLARIAEKHMSAEGLDIVKFHDEVAKLPAGFRSIIMKPEEMNAIKSVVNDKRYVQLNDLVKHSSSMLDSLADPAKLIKAGKAGTQEAHNFVNLNKLINTNMVHDVQRLNLMSEANGRFAKLEAMEPREVMAHIMDPKNIRDFNSIVQNSQRPELPQAMQFYKMRDLLEKSAVDGKLDLTAFQKNLRKEPIHIQNFLVPPKERIVLDATLSDPKYVRFNDLMKSSRSMLEDMADPGAIVEAGQTGTNSARNLGELSMLVNKNMVKDAKTLATMAHFGQRKAPLTKDALKLGINVVRPISDMLQAAPSIPSPLINQAAGYAAGGLSQAFFPGISKPQ